MIQDFVWPSQHAVFHLACRCLVLFWELQLHADLLQMLLFQQDARMS